jgi:hypothetical protein
VDWAEASTGLAVTSYKLLTALKVVCRPFKEEDKDLESNNLTSEKDDSEAIHEDKAVYQWICKGERKKEHTPLTDLLGL